MQVGVRNPCTPRCSSHPSNTAAHVPGWKMRSCAMLTQGSGTRPHRHYKEGTAAAEWSHLVGVCQRCLECEGLILLHELTQGCVQLGRPQHSIVLHNSSSSQAATKQQPQHTFDSRAQEARGCADSVGEQAAGKRQYEAVQGGWHGGWQCRGSLHAGMLPRSWTCSASDPVLLSGAQLWPHTLVLSSSG